MLGKTPRVGLRRRVRQSAPLKVSFRYHVQVLREWRSLNQQIRVVSQKEQKVMSVSVDHLERGDHRLDQSRALLPTPDRDVSPVAIHPHEQVPLFNICTLK